MATKRSRERIQWADLDKHRESLNLSGRGEGLRTVYFDVGFSKPPMLAYSSVLSMPGKRIVPSVIVQPRGSLDNDVDWNGLGNDSQSSWNGYIADPSFEVQSQFSTKSPVSARTIPGVDEVRKMIINNRLYDQSDDPNTQRLPVAQDEFDGVDWLSDIASRGPSFASNYDVDWVDFGGDPAYSWQGPHRWLQTEENRDRWSTTNAQSHDLGVGEAGKYSATAVIGTNGYTNWLIPIGDKWFHQFPWAEPEPDGGWTQPDMPNIFDITDPVYAEHAFYSVREWSGFPWNSDANNREGPLAGTPPYIGGFEGFAYVKCAEDCTFETEAVFHHWEGQAADDGLHEVVFTDDKLTGWGNAASARMRVIATVDDQTSVPGGGWLRVPIKLPYEGKRVYPVEAERRGSRLSWVYDGRTHHVPTSYRYYAETGGPNQFYPYQVSRAPTTGPIDWEDETADGLDQPQDLGEYANPYWRLKFRVKGTPGATVFLDNVYVWKELRNADAPILTVGVAEWIRDEAGVYVGAHLWFKMGQP